MAKKAISYQSFLYGIYMFVLCQSVWSISTYAANNSPVETLISLFSKSATDKATLDQAAQYIDFQYMANQSLGSANWGKLTNQQKNTYVSALKGAIEKRYYPRWHSIFSKSKVDYGKESTNGIESHISTYITVGKSHENLDWTLRRTAGQAKVVNLSVNGKDILVRLGQRFQKKYAQGGFEKFIAWLQGLGKSDSTAKGEAGVD